MSIQRVAVLSVKSPHLYSFTVWDPFSNESALISSNIRRTACTSFTIGGGRKQLDCGSKDTPTPKAVVIRHHRRREEYHTDSPIQIGSKRIRIFNLITTHRVEIQCAAVTTHSGVINVPPQKNPPRLVCKPTLITSKKKEKKIKHVRIRSSPKKAKVKYQSRKTVFNHISNTKKRVKNTTHSVAF